MARPSIPMAWIISPLQGHRAARRGVEGVSMPFDTRDRAIIAASSLVGYCESIRGMHLTFEDQFERDAFVRWGEGLKDKTERAAAALDAVFEINEGTDTEPKS